MNSLKPPLLNLGCSLAILMGVIVGGAFAQPTTNARLDVEAQVINGAVYFSGFSAEQLKIIPDEVENKKQPLVKIWMDGFDQEKLPAVSGELAWVDGSLRYKPDFPFSSGARYNAVFSTQHFSDAPNIWFASPAKKPTPPVEIEAVYPTAGELPENVLKFYVQFSAPMEKGDIYRHISVQRFEKTEKRNVEATEIELPFLEVAQELWSPDSCRLTLLVDPGRIKRGLRPREEAGPVFENGFEYQIIVSGKWLDSDGKPLNGGRDYSKLIRVIETDDVCPDPNKWGLELPKSGSSTSLNVNFDESLDSGLAQRMIRIFDSNNIEVAVKVELGAGQTLVSFKPAKRWMPGKYQLRIDNRLEDLCGNSVARPFDVDVFENSERADADGETVLMFELPEVVR